MKESIRIDISDAICAENKVWCIAKSFSCLFCIDIESKKIISVKEIPETSYYKVNSFLQLRLFNNRIYCIPYNEKFIAVYDITKDKFEIIRIDLEIIQYKGVGGLFSGAAIYNEYLFLLPAFCKTIIRLNMETHEMVYITEWIEQVKDAIFDENEYCFMFQSVIRGGKLYVPFVGANAILELNCSDLQSSIHILGTEHKGYSGITYDGESFWMSKRMLGELISWNPETNVMRNIYLNQEKEKGHWNDCRGIIYQNGQVRFLPMLKENKIENKVENIIKEEGQYLFVKEEEKYILCYEEIKKQLIITDKEKKKQLELNILFDKNLINIELAFQKNKIFLESKEIGLDIMLLHMSRNIIKKKGNLYENK